MRVGIAAGLSVGLACGIEATGGTAAIPKRLVVIAGQSNALGLGVAASVTNYPGIADAYPAVQFVERSSVLSDPLSWTTDALRDLSPRTITVASQVAGTMGVELSLGRTLDATGSAEWYLAKSAIDGSGLENNWNNPAWPATGGSLLSQFSAWITSIEAATGSTLAAIVWIQGEADSTESPDTANYGTNLSSFFSALRATHGNFGVVLNRLSSNYSPGGGRYEVRSWQESWVATDSKAAIVYADDLAFRDTAHFSDDSYATLGIRLASAVMDVIDGPAPVANPRWKAAGIPVIATSAQTLTPTWPAHEAGDIGFLILSGLGVNAYTLSTAAGFAAVTDSPQKDTGVSTSSRLQVWWCRASSSAMASPVVADAASDDAKIAMIVVVKGAASSGDPWDVTAGDAPAAAGTAITFPGVTTTVGNTLIMNILAHRVDSADAQVSGWANADLTDLTEHVDYDVITSLGYGLAVATGVKAAAGAVTGTTATLANSATQARLTIAVKP
jgi:hypothetical protein